MPARVLTKAFLHSCRVIGVTALRVALGSEQAHSQVSRVPLQADAGQIIYFDASPHVAKTMYNMNVLVHVCIYLCMPMQVGIQEARLPRLIQQVCGWRVGDGGRGGGRVSVVGACLVDGSMVRWMGATWGLTIH